MSTAAPDTSVRLPVIVSALLAIALYAISLNGTFIWDDQSVILEDERIGDPSRWVEYLTKSYNGNVDNLYRPLVSATYVLQSQLHGDRAMPYHAVNLLLNAAVCALVAALAHRLSGVRAAWIAGLLFAAHPLHVEAVSYIVGRAELMCAIGFLSAMLLYTRPLTTRRAWAIWACCLFSILSKEQGLLVPIILFATGWMRRWSTTELHIVDPITPAERKGTRTLVLLLSWTLAAYIAFRAKILPFHWETHFLDWTMNPLKLATGPDRWLMPVVLLGRYTALLFFPWRLSPDYSGHVIGWHVSWADPYLYLGFASFLLASALLLIALFCRKTTPFIILLTLGLTYGLVSNFASIIGVMFAERLMYLPSAFLILLIAYALQNVPTRRVAPALGVVLVLASWRTVSYAARWNDRLAFYEQSWKEQPKSVRLAILVATELHVLGQTDRAAEVAARACELEPGYHGAWLTRGFIAMEQHRWDEAQKDLDTAFQLEISPAAYAYRVQLSERRAATQPGTTQPTSTPPVAPQPADRLFIP